MAKFGATGARHNLEALARLSARLAGVSEAAIRTADKRAIASVRRRFEPTAKRILRAQYNVKAGDLKGAFQVRSGMDSAGEYLELHASTRKLPLIAFSGRWGGRKTKGATAQILREARKTYDSAFIATVGGRKRILVRQFSRDSHLASGRDPRNKLRSLTGPSPLQMVKGIDDINARQISRDMNQFRATEIMRQLKLARRSKS